MPPFAPGMPGLPPVVAPANPAGPPAAKKKEKPKEKIPIPGTTWTKVITTEGNVFYTEKTTKKSSWTIPDEISAEVKAYEAEQRAERIRKEEEERMKAEEAKVAADRERERIRKELEEERRRKQQEETERRRAAEQARAENEKKRKAEEADGEEARASKVAKVDENEGEPQEAEEVDDEDEGQAGPEDAEDEEAWQKAVAAELAAEHAEQQAIKKAEKQAKKDAEEQARVAVFQAPTKVEFTAEEGRALFKVSRHITIACQADHFSFARLCCTTRTFPILRHGIPLFRISSTIRVTSFSHQCGTDRKSLRNIAVKWRALVGLGNRRRRSRRAKPRNGIRKWIIANCSRRKSRVPGWPGRISKERGKRTGGSLHSARMIVSGKRRLRLT